MSCAVPFFFSTWSDSCACMLSLHSVWAANWYCLTVILLGSLFLGCQDLSAWDRYVPPSFIPFSVSFTAESAHILVTHFPLCKRYDRTSFGYVHATFHHIPEMYDSVSFKPASPGWWQHLCLVCCCSIICAPWQLFDWNLFRKPCFSYISETVPLLIDTSSMT